MQKTKSVAVLLFERFSNHCLANAVEPLRGANMLAGAPLYSWHFVAASPGPIRSSSGLPVMPEAQLPDQPGGDLLLVMPSYGFEAAIRPQVLRALRAAARRFEAVAGLDTGAWLMAAAGLLDGRRATIHWDEIDRFAETFPEIDVREDRFVIDGDRITCAGATATLDLMLALIGRDDAMLALEVAALFMRGERPVPVPAASGVDAVEAASAIMRRNVEEPLTIRAIAARLGLSQRALEQRFRARIGQSPRRVYAVLRLRAARRLVESTELSITEIATRAGYRDASAMTRAFRAEFGQPPRAVRQASIRPR